MSEVRLLVREAEGDWSGTIHGSLADSAIAALSVDPVTMAELKAGMARFTPSRSRGGVLSNLTPGSTDEPYDAGLVVIDLAARVVVVDSTYSLPSHEGVVDLHDGREGRGGREGSSERISYHVSDDWLFLYGPSEWKGVAENRRRERGNATECHPRKVFYGRPLLEFIAREVFTHYQRRDQLAQEARERILERLNQQSMEEMEAVRVKLKRLSDDDILLTPWPRLAMYDPPLLDVFRNIHANWLLTPRSDLNGLSPRDWGVRQCSHVGWDIEDRSQQWASQGECPPGLEECSHAYQHGDFGPHELVLYYELVRHLLSSCWEQLTVTTSASSTCDKGEMPLVEEFMATEIDRLSRVLEEWFDAPDPEYHMRTPRSIVRQERLRLPATLSPHETIIDPDCPCCQMMAEMPGPVFWDLDGTNMDEDFAFDLSFRTREEWEIHRRDWEEATRAMEAEWRERARMGLDNSGHTDSDEGSIWTASFSVGDTSDLPLGVRTFGVGCHLAEVICDLRRLGDQEVTTPRIQQAIDQLNRDFGNLRDVLQNASDSVAETLLQPILSQFTDTLAEVARDHPELAVKCEALANNLERFLEQPPEGESDFLDVPY